MYFISRKIVWFLTNSVDPDETRQKLHDIWIFTIAESCLQRINAFYHIWTYPDPFIPSWLCVSQLFCWSSDNSWIMGEYSFTQG